MPSGASRAAPDFAASEPLFFCAPLIPAATSRSAAPRSLSRWASETAVNRPAETKRQFNTAATPVSLCFLFGFFYVLEQADDGGECRIRVYNSTGRRLRSLRPKDSNGDELLDWSPYRLRVCHKRQWLLAVEKDGDRVRCLARDGTLQKTYGPTISKRYSMESPEDALVCYREDDGDLLLVCCPLVGVLFVSMTTEQPFCVTQTNGHLGLTWPVRIAWSTAGDYLIVVDDKSPKQYTVHRLSLRESGTACQLVRSAKHLIWPSDTTPVPTVSHHRLLLTKTCLKGASPSKGGASGVHWLSIRGFDTGKFTRNSVATADNWRVTDACYVSQTEMAVCDKRGVSVLLRH